MERTESGGTYKELWDGIIALLKANGFDSITDAVVRAEKAEALASRLTARVEGLEEALKKIIQQVDFRESFSGDSAFDRGLFEGSKSMREIARALLPQDGEDR